MTAPDADVDTRWCTWCGEPDDPEMGPVRADDDMHAGCATSAADGGLVTVLHHIPWEEIDT
jgi:hypothetical protein